jgi:hypothetical protein
MMWPWITLIGGRLTVPPMASTESFMVSRSEALLGPEEGSGGDLAMLPGRV